MPRKKNITTNTTNTDDLVEAQMVPRVIEALGKSLADTIAKVVEDRLGALLGRVVELEKGLEKVDTERQALADENQALRIRLDDLEAYSKGENLIIHGLEVTSYSEAVGGAASKSSSRPGTPSSSPAPGNGPVESHRGTEDAVIALANNILNVPLTRDDVSVAHRLPKRPSDTRPSPIIVRFTNRRARNAVFHARKTLRSKNLMIFVNEHLIKARATLLSEARKLVREKKLEGAWTNNGVIFIRLSGATDSRPLRVDSLKDLPRG